jgi:hypothetical protein
LDKADISCEEAQSIGGFQHIPERMSHHQQSG